MVLFWFRRDLRMHDNTALNAAIATGEPVLPLFIFDSSILSELPRTDARVTFIHDQLEQINNRLREFNSSVAIFHGTPSEIFAELLERHKPKAVFTNEDYEPYAIKRDNEVENLLNAGGVSFHRFKDQVMFAKSEIVKDDGKPYVVFTPYSKKWLAAFRETEIKTTDLPNRPSFVKHTYPFLTLEQIGFERSEIKIPEFSLEDFVVARYDATRDYPAQKTTRLGPHLRFGTVSIREIAKEVAPRNATLLTELIWREFFMQILFHFPHTTTKSFRPEYDAVPWRNDIAEFESWKNGTTGIPIVDAGMRELHATGFMHNRVRMIVASFLCKNLLIDWRWGEAYFAEKLLDYELASNVGNWQWAAGSGVDAAPYFRVFNPNAQAEKFDSKADYIRKWVPEFDSLTYPQPMVDLKASRERAIATYKQALSR